MRMAAEATDHYVNLLNGADPSTIPFSALTSTSSPSSSSPTTITAGSVAPPQKTEKKEKKIKDPNAPKRPASAYIDFQNSMRSKIKADNPDITGTELQAKVSEMWKQMGEEEKKVSCRRIERERA